jgi:hypothetical protein
MKGATRRDKESEKERNDGDPFLDILGFNKKKRLIFLPFSLDGVGSPKASLGIPHNRL